MKIIDNSSALLGDELKNSLGKGSRLKVAASCFSIYAFEALKSELGKIEAMQFIFTTPTFVPSEVTDRVRKERREFFMSYSPIFGQISGVFKLLPAPADRFHCC